MVVVHSLQVLLLLLLLVLLPALVMADEVPLGAASDSSSTSTKKSLRGLRGEWKGEINSTSYCSTS